MTHPESYVNRQSEKPRKLDMVEVPWKDGTPFLDPEELADPRIAKWRQILRDNCKSKNF